MLRYDEGKGGVGSRSASHHVLFEAERLGLDELPDRTIVNLQPKLSELGDQAAQGKSRLGSARRAIYHRAKLAGDIHLRVCANFQIVARKLSNGYMV